MRLTASSALIVVLFWFTAGTTVYGEKITFSKDRFSIVIPARWEKAAVRSDPAAVLQYDAPAGAGSFSAYSLPVGQNRKANLEKTLAVRVRTFEKAGLVLTGKVQSQKQENFDGKPAIFGVVPMEAMTEDDVVRFTYYIVLIDAQDSVIMMQAALPRPLAADLQKDALSIIQSFRENAAGS